MRATFAPMVAATSTSVVAASKTAGAMIGSVAARLGSCHMRATRGASRPKPTDRKQETATVIRMPVPSALCSRSASPAARWAGMNRCIPCMEPTIPARVSTSRIATLAW